MIYKLRDNHAIIPGGFFYYQPEPKAHRFPSAPVVEDTARAVASYRAANNLPRASFEESYIDVVHFHGVRLGGNPSYFSKVEEAEAAAVVPPPPASGCKGCGAAVNHN